MAEGPEFGDIAAERQANGPVGGDGRRSVGLLAEGVRLGEASANELRGWGWDMRTDAEMEFVVDLATGMHTGGPKF